MNEKEIEKLVDRKIMGFKNRKGTARKLALLTLFLVACGFGAGYATATFSHPGQLAADGCHRNNAEGNRHYHVEGTREFSGLCDENGPIINFVVTRDCMAAIEEVSDRLLNEWSISSSEEEDMGAQLENSCLHPDLTQE